MIDLILTTINWIFWIAGALVIFAGFICFIDALKLRRLK